MHFEKVYGCRSILIRTSFVEQRSRRNLGHGEDFTVSAVKGVVGPQQHRLPTTEQESVRITFLHLVKF